MPEEGIALRPRDQILTFEEIERLARLFVRSGVEKIRLTGGEPLVRKDVEQLAARLASIPGLRTLAMTTNGLLLPKKLPALHSAGITQFNISLDTLDACKFESITRRKGLELVLQAISMAIEYGYNPVKVNCVVMRGFNEDELPAFVAMTADKPVEVRFIEYMPFDGNEWNEARLMPYAEMLDRVRSSFPNLVRLQEGPNDTARTYKVPGCRGAVGFITSMSNHFCATCNRLRITADGNLKVCLFGREEINLREVMRSGASDDELIACIREGVQRKKAAHDGMHELAAGENRPMILIGG